MTTVAELLAHDDVAHDREIERRARREMIREAREQNREERQKLFDSERDAMAKWLSEKPDIVTDTRAFNQWADRQPHVEHMPVPVVRQQVITPAEVEQLERATRETLAQHKAVKLIDSRVGIALAGFKQDQQALVDDRIDAVFRAVGNTPVEALRVAIGQVISVERKRSAALELRVDALLAEIEKLQRGLGEGARIIDLPALPMRSERRG